MQRIKIDDLPEEQKISKKVMKKVVGGSLLIPIPKLAFTSPFSYPQQHFSRSASMVSSMWRNLRDIESSVIDNLK